MNFGFLNDLINSLVKKKPPQPNSIEVETNGSISSLLKKLMSRTGDVSAIVLATEILDRYHNFSKDEKLTFFQILESEYNSDINAVRTAFATYDAESSSQNLNTLFEAVEPPRQELLRRLNRAPEATYKLVCMRGDLLNFIKSHSELKAIEHDFIHLFASWFNRGFLVMKSIDWSTPASILEKIIHYEAVHKINSWDELRHRLAPENRRCFAFFHPAILDEPLIFVEVALTNGIPTHIDDILSESSTHDGKADTATFYSISNCQNGLKNISFGNFLIKQVVQELRMSLPDLKQFVTLSPIPTFSKWLKQTHETDIIQPVNDEYEQIVAMENKHHQQGTFSKQYQHTIKQLAAEYLVNIKDKKYPVDPVARFHLGNGATLYQINACADMSKKGYQQSLGTMVNYLYHLESIEINHENYVTNGVVNCSEAINELLQQ